MHAPLFIDVAGLRLTDTDRARLAHPLVGGLILFGRNWKDRRQLSALCKQIKSQDFYLHRRLPVATLIWSVSFRGPRRKSGGRSTMLERSA